MIKARTVLGKLQHLEIAGVDSVEILASVFRQAGSQLTHSVPYSTLRQTQLSLFSEAVAEVNQRCSIVHKPFSEIKHKRLIEPFPSTPTASTYTAILGEDVCEA